MIIFLILIASGEVLGLACDHQLPECSFIEYKKINKSQLHMAEPPAVKFGNPNTTEEYWTHTNWLRSYFHFNFGDYYEEGNVEFGVLRVLNDDLIQAQRGFGKHPHSDMEIVSYIVSGELVHKDSGGNKEHIYARDLQVISAGTGIEHQEANPRARTPTRLIQSWVLPRTYSNEPKYYSVKNYELVNNTFIHLIGDVKVKGPQLASVNQDFNLYSSEFDQEMIFNVGKKRMVYVLCITGPVRVTVSLEQQFKLSTYEAAKVWGSASIYFYPLKGNGHILVYEMKKQSQK